MLSDPDSNCPVRVLLVLLLVQLLMSVSVVVWHIPDSVIDYCFIVNVREKVCRSA